jgi:DNA recombination protein RmuC
LLSGVVLAVAAGAAGYLAATRWSERAARERDRERHATHEALELAVTGAVEHAVADVRAQASQDRDAAVAAALEQSAVLQREQLGATASLVQQHATADLPSTAASWGCR